jgi:tripartite-type tricarboxylate transporter receptor subunit TctC
LPSRRDFLKTSSALAAVAFGEPGPGWRWRASDSPRQLAATKIRWIVPFTPGGGYDIYSRLIVPFYEQRLGVEIVVQNVPGAGGAIGARTLMQAPVDGSVLGLLPAPGLLVAALTGQVAVPNPATDFTVLGRVAPLRHVWVTGQGSGLSSMPAVFEAAKRRPIVFGVSEAASVGFFHGAVAADLLGVEDTYLAGYAGTRETSWAVARGDADLESVNFDSVIDRIESGDLVPILQVSNAPIPHPMLDGLPLLGGEDGLAVQRARILERDPERAEAVVSALIRLGETGRIVAGPGGMPAHLSDHLGRHLEASLLDPEFQAAAAAANRPLAVADAAAARANLEAAVGSAEILLPIVRRAIDKLRQ